MTTTLPRRPMSRPASSGHRVRRPASVAHHPHPSRGRPGNDRKVQVGTPRRRVAWLLVFVVLGFVGLAGRLAQIQVFGRETYTALGDRQAIAASDIPASRGAILDRDFSVLALSDGRPTVWADPRLVTDPYATALALGSVLDIDVDLIRSRLASDRHFVYVDRQVTQDERLAVEALELGGVNFTEEMTRLLPNGSSLARGVIGSVDPDQEPLSGLEKQFGDVLGGSGGSEVSQVSIDGISLPLGSSYHPAESGHDLVLTLDTETQWLTEQVLLDAVTTSNARGAMAVVMETTSGEILALASVRRDEETGEAAVLNYNAPYVDSFEPGSVLKAFTIAAALEEQQVRDDELFSVPPEYDFADKTFREPFASAPRAMTTSEILAKSSNIGTIMIAERLGRDQLYRYLEQFGFGSVTGVDGGPAVPGEASGILLPASEWHGTAQATISFGQGVAVTAVQLAAGFNTIANDGIYLLPSISAGTVGPDGTFHAASGGERRRVVSASTARDVRAMLESAVTNGTGGNAAIDGYAVAGKTGTAQKPLDGQSGYSETAYMSTFAGFVPADDPALTIVVTIDEAESYLAGVVAAPVFADIAEYALRVQRVPPGR